MFRYGVRWAITVILRELFRKIPDLEIVGEPDRLASFFNHGIKRTRCIWTLPPRQDT